MAEGIAGLAEAFAAATAEVGEANPIVSETALPAETAEVETGSEQAEVPLAEQPDVAETPASVDEELQSLVDDLSDEDEEEDAVAEKAADPVSEFLASDDFWSTEIEVDAGDGSKPITVKELTDGYLRQADYTRKTQLLATERAAIEDAVGFHEAFKEDPLAFARALAVRAELINEGDEPIKKIDAVKIPTAAELEAEIEKRVAERLDADPRALELKVASARAEVNAEFDRIQADRGITLSPEVRQHILNVAVRGNTSDFELVLDGEMYRKQQQKQKVGAKQRNAPARPTTPGSTPKGGDLPIVSDLGEAFTRGLAELGAA